MAFKIPAVLRYEIQHRLESLRSGAGGEGPRDWVNAHPLLIAGVATLSMALVGTVLISRLWAGSDTARVQSKSAWFYDINTGRPFQGSPKKTGPIEAPSGPASNGEPAGFRAHVYSYVLDPNEAELFVGFLERPDPESESKCSVADFKEFDKWARSRLIRRPDDRDWVRATSPEGQALLEELAQPNERGQTPIYYIPRP